MIAVVGADFHVHTYSPVEARHAVPAYQLTTMQLRIKGEGGTSPLQPTKGETRIEIWF